ncbi:MAG: hypothetical protein PSV40_16455 [Polaromonas sp.]|uniref:hypothetical protein n=1 Tax=Polaromonas sp. TaxID=1869339 RepID=UPI002486D857|nr:hypothetical protein [Polaromonas sp.]MDI1270676.1 hypothetical protein [Polaromonas sp.]
MRSVSASTALQGPSMCWRAAGAAWLKGGQLSLLNPRALHRIADYYDLPMRKVPLL